MLLSNYRSFFWAAKSFGSEVDIDSFARFYELHRQKRTKFLEKESPTLSYQFGICTFTSKRKSDRLGLEKNIFLMPNAIDGTLIG